MDNNMCKTPIHSQSEELKTLQTKLETIMEGSPNSVLIVDDTLKLIEILASKDVLHDYILKYGINKSLEEIFPDKENIQQFVDDRKIFNKVICEQIRADFSYKIKHEGAWNYYYAQATPYKGNQIMISTRNVSQLKKQENEIKALHELVNTIIDHLPMGVFVKDANDNFNYLYWNKFMEDFTGINTEDIEGKNDAKINSHALMSAEQRLDFDNRVIETGEVMAFLGKVRSVTGEEKEIEVTKYPISLSDGKPLLLVLWQDMTSRLAIENALRRTRMLTKTALLTSDIRTCSLFVNQESVNFQDTTVQLYKVDSMTEEMRTISWSAFFLRVHPDDKELYEECFLQLCRGEKSDVKMEARVLFEGSNKYCWRETTAFVYEHDELDRPSVILGCSINIQQRKEQEFDLSNAKSKAEIADKLKSRYLANMSHEIRTPLNAITGFSELLAYADSDEERRSYYEIIRTNNELLMQLVNDILDMSKIEADMMKITNASIEVNEFLEGIYVSAKLRMPEQVELILKVESTPCLFISDPVRLMQLVNNLLNNAIKNTKQGSVTFGYTHTLEQINFYVKDTGIGIAKERLADIFGRYIKLNDYVEGIGLGLAICQGLVSKMGGNMCVNSVLGEGSTFSFTLPLHTQLEE